MLVESGARCLSGLREKPEEAVVRAAARHFYALREQRRRRLGLGLGVTSTNDQRQARVHRLRKLRAQLLGLRCCRSQLLEQIVLA